MAKNELRIFDTLLDVSLMDKKDPKRGTKITKYETADKEQAEARTESD